MRTNLFLTAALSLCLCAASTAQTLPAYLPTDGLVGWWPFNGNANDESGNGNDLTNQGGSFIADRNNESNSAISLTSSLTYLSVLSVNPSIAINQSLSLWFKIPQQFNYSTLNLLGNGIAYNYGYAIYIDQNDAVYGLNNYSIGYIIGNGQSITFNASQNELVDWNNLIAIYSGDSLRLYFNNVLKGTLAYSGGTNAIDDNLRIGSWDNPSLPQNTLRELDDIAIYNRALSPEEITALYTGEPVNPPTACNPLPSNLQNGLVGYWPFCGNANDESGNGNNGTVNGATLTEDRFGVANAAYDFDGVDDFITGTISDLNSTSTTTVSAWIKYIGDAGGPPYDSYFQLGNYGSHTFAYAYNYSGQNLDLYSQCFANPYTEINLNNSWHNVIVVDSLNNTKVYVDGELLTEFLWGDNSNCYSGSSQFYIGGPGDNQHTTGSLDDIGIWNRALTANEVQQLYTLNACTFTIYDTLTTTLTETVFDTVMVTETIFDTITVTETIIDTIFVTETLIDTVTVTETLFVTVYDTVLTTVTDTLIINTLITELAPPANTNTIKVFPNPAGSILTIDYGNFALMNGYQLRIENSLGQEVFQTNISQQSDTLSLGTWGGNGLYFVHIVDPQGNTVDIRKIVLQ